MKVIKNYLYNLSYQLLTIILPLITIPYTSRILGAKGLGAYALTNTYAQYFVLLGMLGLSTYSSREIAYNKDDSIKTNEVFWEINFLRLITLGVSLIIYIILFGIFLNTSYKILYMIQILTILSALIDISWLFIGLENFKKVVIRNSLVKILGVILIFILVKDSSQVWIYALILGITQFIGQIIMWFEVPQFIKFIMPKKSYVIKHLKFSIRLFIPQIAINIYTMLDKVMLGELTNEVQVGMYDNSQRVIKILVTIVSSLAIVTIPKMAYLYKEKKIGEFVNNAYKSFSFVSFIAFPMSFGVVGVCKFFVPWFYGPGFEKIIPMFYVGSFLIISLGWSSILGNQILISIKREKQFTISVAIGALVNVILNIALIKKYEGLGTTISSVIAEYTGMFIMAFFLRDILDIKKVFASSIKYFISSLIMLSVIFKISTKMNVSVFNTAVLVGVGGGVYLLIMILIRDRNLIYGIEYIKNFIKKK